MDIKQLSYVEQERLTSTLKFILIGVALSLLYTTEVGKIRNEQFLGMMAEELRDLLNGKLAPKIDPNKKLTLNEELTLSLIQQAQIQLASMNQDEKILAIDTLLQYLEQTRDVNLMTDPKKVFAAALGTDETSIIRQIEAIRG